MLYEKSVEVKVIRTRHKIILYLEGSADSLKKALVNIPDEAKLVDKDSTNDEARNTILIFEEEKKDE